MTNSDTSYKKILVLGAGELGLAVLEGLVAQQAEHRDLELSVLLRPTSSASRDVLNAWQVQVVEGDLAAQSVEELTDIFRPFDAVICCSGFAGGPGTQLKITRACLAAKIRRYIPWQFGVDYQTIGYGSG